MIAIVGAGISGLCSALTLLKLGHKIVLIDKGRSVGGRVATRYYDHDGTRRYIDTAAHDIELTDDSPRFNEFMRGYFPDQAAQHSIKGGKGINSIMKKLGNSLDGAEILLDHKALSINYDGHARRFKVESGSKGQRDIISVDGVIVTPPIPQSIELLTKFPRLVEKLDKAAPYNRYLLLLLWPKQSIPKGSLNKPETIDSIIYQDHIQDNTAPIPIAVHATYRWSNEHYGLKDEEVKQEMMAQVGIQEANYHRIQVKRWGQAQPQGTGPYPDGFVLDSEHPLVVCSDALNSGKINLAGEAGIRAAHALSDRLRSNNSKI